MSESGQQRRDPFVRFSAAAVAGSRAPGAGSVPTSSRLGTRDRDSIGFSLPAAALNGGARRLEARQLCARGRQTCEGQADCASDVQSMQMQD
jgi:hypothetical protein